MISKNKKIILLERVLILLNTFKKGDGEEYIFLKTLKTSAVIIYWKNYYIFKVNCPQGVKIKNLFWRSKEYKIKNNKTKYFKHYVHIFSEGIL